MRICDYHALRASGRSPVRRFYECNSLPSETDPTQDCPVSAFQYGPDGSVINCRSNGLPFNGIPIEQMTAIESRHRDTFDVLGQQQELAKTASKSMKNSKKKPLLTSN